MIDHKFVGKKAPLAKYEIGKEKIKEFALATGDKNPLYLDDDYAKDSKFGGIIAPPMFAVVYAKEPVGDMLLDPELGLNLMMLVHGEEEFEFLEIVRPGDVITTEGWIGNIYEKEEKKLDFIVLETVSSNQEGKIVCKAKWIFVIREG
ncbi:MAG: hypothetical protein COS84_06575 [Armatimonadetes bacterium CG07_land_8_20_14_0_80_40_9]|nr:MAG: hypothetical protein COS84_06575 [Armatimonadetes bacterium CG07_land_8_20_14_0_80_40_9]